MSKNQVQKFSEVKITRVAAWRPTPRRIIGIDSWGYAIFAPEQQEEVA